MNSYGGASKGILICTSGFAKSNYQYAQTLGIELLTVEDINSDRWKADIQVPLIYIRKSFNYYLTCEFIGNEQLAEKNRDEDLVINFDINSMITRDNGATALTIKTHIETCLAESEADAQEGVELDLLRPDLRFSVADVWVECRELTVTLAIVKTHYLKYLTPEEYSQVRDHLRHETLPLYISISGPGKLDDSFVEIPSGDLPVVPGFSFTIEEWMDLERALGKRPFRC